MSKLLFDFNSHELTRICGKPIYEAIDVSRDYEIGMALLKKLHKRGLEGFFEYIRVSYRTSVTHTHKYDNTPEFFAKTLYPEFYFVLNSSILKNPHTKCSISIHISWKKEENRINHKPFIETDSYQIPLNASADNDNIVKALLQALKLSVEQIKVEYLDGPSLKLTDASQRLYKYYEHRLK